MDWDFIPKQSIWFRDPQVAMIWDLSGPGLMKNQVDQKPK